MKIALITNLVFFLKFIYKARNVFLTFLSDAKKKEKKKNKNKVNDNESINWSRDHRCKILEISKCLI